MQFIDKKLLIALALICAAAGRAPGTGSGPAADVPGPRELTASEAQRAMNFVYEGKTRSAVDYLDSLEVACAGEPFFLLIKARVARELLTVDDESKERIKADSEPIHRDLERVIELCSRRLDSAGENGPGADPRLLLYRGLAWMSKSHLSSFERRFWRAGRDAKKGKSDLEEYLETDPDEPLALGTLGVFLYFADTIPSLFKYVSKILLMPTGDREKGLHYLERAAAGESVLQVEFEMVRYTILVLFEGRYQDGLDGTLDLLTRYPGKPRLALPLALMQPFNPFSVAANAERIDALLERYETHIPGEAERYELTILDFLSAHADRFVAPPAVAEAELTRLANTNPPHPDWAGGYAAFELGRLQASQGQAEDARSAFAWVRHNDKVSYVHGDAAKMSKAIDDDPPESTVEPSWITEIYFGDRAARDGSAAMLASVAPPTVEAQFYLGDALLLAGDTEAALTAYRAALDMKAALWDEEFQLLAGSRAAEIHGARGEYEDAVRELDRALKYYHKEFLWDWLLEGRKRYFERLRDGKEDHRPRFFTDVR